MQCANCKFENMPGVILCGRCGASLKLATANIDVHPPRARPIVKKLRRSFRLFKGIPVLISRCENAIENRITPLRRVLPSFTILLRILIPGWLQFFRGRKRLGTTFLVGYLLGMVLGGLFVCTLFGNLCIGIALTCHISSILNGLNTDRIPFRVLLVQTFLCMSFLLLLLYFPAHRLISQFVVPYRFAADIPPLRAYDVFLYTPWAYRNSLPNSGDVVFYTFEGNLRGGTYELRSTEIAGRVLATPNQHVEIKNNTIRVDGKLFEYPLGIVLPETYDYQVTVPANRLLVITSIPILGTQILLVSPERILGKVFWRLQPFSEFGTIR